MQGRLKGIASILVPIILSILFILFYVHPWMVDPLPEGISTYSADIDEIYFVIYYITGFIFILVTCLLVGFIIKYRYKEGQPAVYSHGNTALELVWTAIPAVVFIVLFLISDSTWKRVKQFAPPGDVEVRLTAVQFKWEFQYPGPDGKFDTPDDKTIDDDLHVPVNKVVRVYLRAKDVIHSFFVPVLRLKQDVVPGREIIAWFEVTKTGEYEIPCAELCGPGHSGMLGKLMVYTAEDYEEWVRKQWPSS